MIRPITFIFFLLTGILLVLALHAVTFGGVKNALGLLMLLLFAGLWLFTLGREDRFTASAEYRAHQAAILRAFPVDQEPEPHGGHLPWDFVMGAPVTQYGVTRRGLGNFQRTSFWSQQMHGHIDSVAGKTTAVDIRPNVGRWKASAEDIVGPAAARSRGAQ